MNISIHPLFALLRFAAGARQSAARTGQVSGTGHDTHAGTSAGTAFRTAP